MRYFRILAPVRIGSEKDNTFVLVCIEFFDRITRQYGMRKHHLDSLIVDVLNDIIEQMAQCSSCIYDIIIDIDFLVIHMDALIGQQSAEGGSILASPYLIDDNIFTGIFRRKDRIIFSASIIRGYKYISRTKNTGKIIEKFQIGDFDI